MSGIDIVSRKEDGYINATMLCKAGGKEYSGWIRNSKTTEFLTELSMYLHLCRTTLIQSKQGGQEQGTWIHPRCAIHLAQWISPEFAVKITGWIEELLASGSVKIDRPIGSFTLMNDNDKDAIEMEIKDFSKNSNNPCVYVAYIGNSMIKVGYSDNITLRNLKHQSSESKFQQFRIVGIYEVSGKPVEKILHDYLIKDKIEFGKQKEIYKIHSTLKEFNLEIATFLSQNDLKLMVKILREELIQKNKQIYDLQKQLQSLSQSI